MAASDPCKPPVGVSQSSTSTYRSVPESDFWTAVKGGTCCRLAVPRPALLGRCWGWGKVGKETNRPCV